MSTCRRYLFNNIRHITSISD